ncbi:MAG: hypothetical protein O7A69_06165 [SAR324 cluster bacterium]|nr:hypothetical protein [SAR324 cluster bacterium]
MHTLLFLDPGHFHAALTLREAHPLVNEEFFLYAEEGPHVRAFLDLIESFNGRAERPTRWRPQVTIAADPMERLMEERRGEAVVIAGKNDSKMESILRLHEAGFHVLADKPWLIAVEGLASLRLATATAPLAMDIMTGRFEVTHILPKRLTEEEEIFGTFQPPAEGGAAITMDSIHHLCKTVNGKPLLRPGWYFDVRVQGDGIVDIPCHLVDKVLWMMGGESWDFDRDVELLSARRWATAVPPAPFAKVTGAEAYPPFLSGDLHDGVLQLLCNGEFSFRLRGVPVRLRGEWRLEAPPGGGDTYQFLIHGTRAVVAVEMNAHTQFQPRVFVRPLPGEQGVGEALRRALTGWQGEFPGLAAVPAPDGFELIIPAALRSTHEEHFPMVLAEFLGYLEAGAWPVALPNSLLTKYSLTARATALAQQGEGD